MISAKQNKMSVLFIPKTAYMFYFERHASYCVFGFDILVKKILCSDPFL